MRCVCSRLSVRFTAVCVSCAIIFEIVAAHWTDFKNIYFRCTLLGFDSLFGLRTLFLVKPEWTDVKGPRTSNFDLRTNRMDWASVVLLLCALCANKSRYVVAWFFDICDFHIFSRISIEICETCMRACETEICQWISNWMNIICSHSLISGWKTFLTRCLVLIFNHILYHSHVRTVHLFIIPHNILNFIHFPNWGMLASPNSKSWIWDSYEVLLYELIN